MGLSTTASFGIIFTASLFMLGMLLNALIYSYTTVNQGFEERSDIMEGVKNVVEVERIIYNSSRIEIMAVNSGPKTLEVDKLSILVNGSVVNFTATGDYWYPGQRKRIFLDATYDIGENHDIQFTIGAGGRVIASCEGQRIYLLTSAGLSVYSYEGEKLWSVGISSPLDVTVDTYIFVLNATEILEYDMNGNYVRSFAQNLGIVGIDAYRGSLYAVSPTTFYIFDYSGTQIKSFGIIDGKDVAVGKYVYILEGNSVEKDDYSGNYVSMLTDSRITNATRISATPELGDTVFILNGDDELLIYESGSYHTSISLEEPADNIDVYGKIYLSGSELYAMNIGHPVKLVDEYGNCVYDYL